MIQKIIYKIKNISFLFILCFSNCDAQQNRAVLTNYENTVFSVNLPSELEEISGLALSDDGKLFGNQDESGIIYELDPKTGKIIKKFFLGYWTIDRDFEGIAIVKDDFYLITSDGYLFKCKEGTHGENVEYEVYKLGFSSRFDIEGLCYDRATNALLIACKNYPGKNFKGKRAVYSMDLSSMQVNKTPRFLIDIKYLEEEFSFNNFSPSAIEIAPDGESFLILSSRGEKGIVEISKEGKILTAFKFKKKKHRQPESITFLKNNAIVIGDEASGKKAKLTIYSPVKK